jgi:hypothetical protein
MPYRWMELHKHDDRIVFVFFEDLGGRHSYDGYYEGTITENRRLELAFCDVRNLPETAPQLPPDYKGTDLFWIPESQCWIGFHVCDTRKSELEPHDQTFIGPFLVRREPPAGTQHKHLRCFRKDSTSNRAG